MVLSKLNFNPERYFDQINLQKILDFPIQFKLTKLLGAMRKEEDHIDFPTLS
ncbi:hypothetical protein CK203_011452 [Vitis vinifera]|uniref:Uncharacterized protein n=1 Tax=Vitis vinifera TaxID=29760 RepID=A0A438JYN7_VITVI|nr:hypothetical protein CK203_011452 [Vitis vinifera]